jgi:hypothetical protein
MTLLPSNQDLTAASGLVNIPFLEGIYHSMMDEAMLDMGRVVTFHLPAIRQQDTTTQSKAAPQQFNPFFGGVAVPQHTTRQPGVQVTHRDVNYNAQIVLGPQKVDNDAQGIGELLDGEAMITVVIEALEHVEEAHSVSIEGRRYAVQHPTRPVGFSQRRYLMVKLREIQELEPGTPDNTVG